MKREEWIVPVMHDGKSQLVPGAVHLPEDPDYLELHLRLIADALGDVVVLERMRRSGNMSLKPFYELYDAIDDLFASVIPPFSLPILNLSMNPIGLSQA